jgi:IS5 family transposase
VEHSQLKGKIVMRKRFELQYELGATPIEQVEIPLNSRDELPPTLRALQHIYTTPELNKKVFDILERKILPTVDFTTGRPGMNLWEILVLGTVRWTRNTNYDHLHHIANFDGLVRKLLGISDFCENLKQYSLQTLKDNIGLLDEETLNEINKLVVKTGHSLKKNETLNVKVDTYVLETNVHFPADLNLLWDASRKSITLISQIVTDADSETGWRKHHDWHKRVKACYHKAAKLTVGAGRLSPKGINAALDYLHIAGNLSQKIKGTKDVLKEIAGSNFRVNKFNDLLYFEEHLNKHIDLVRRRINYRENIPHEEKVFSLFEPYTEWIKKGKAGNKVELGLRIAVATDQYGFILSHKVIQQEQDVDIAVPFAKELIDNYDIDSLSYDKGCWSPKNYQELKRLVLNVVLPKKGRRNKEETEREHSKQFKALRKQHAAVESDINCLEHHGLNRCPDKGLAHFKRYTSFGVLACNLHKLGTILLEQDREQLSKSPPLAKAA